jgi:dipeptidyl aminopeptidase/acylaminoacyl peptidase
MMMRTSCCILFLLGSFAPARASTKTLADFAALREVKAVALSRDGNTIACTVSVPDLKINRMRSELWLLPVLSGAERRIASEIDPIEKVLWSPLGGQLAVLGAARPDKASPKPATYLWLVDTTDGSVRRLAPVERSNHYLAHQGSGLCWSPDGAFLAYLGVAAGSTSAATEPLVVERIQYKTRTAFSDNRPTHIWTVEVATGKTRQLTTGRHDEHSIDWSPKGDEIVFCSNRHTDPDANLNYDLCTVKVADGSIQQLTQTAGNEMAPVWSPDGRSIAYTMTKRSATTIDSVAEDDHVWVLDRQKGTTRELTAELDRRCSQVCWAPDSNNVYFLARDRGKSLIYQAAIETGKAAPVFSKAAMVTGFSIPKRGDRACCILSTPTQPSEVWTFGRDGSDLVMRTHFNVDAAGRLELVAPQVVECKSFDGTPLEGWLLLPKGATPQSKVPLILFIHGGPHGMYGYQFSTAFQTACTRGYAVLYLNPRGSTGYGQRFSDGCVNDWGGADYKDLMAGLDHVLAHHPELDAARLGVTGGSYGGYMTNWIITQTDRFKAAVSYAGLSNLISFYATSLYQDLIHVEFGGPPWERYEILWERSPLRHVKRVTTPTLILHGEADNDVHVTQAEELYTALKYRGIETVFARYPRQGHGATEPRQQLDQLERTVAWFDRWLQPRR